MSEEVKRVGNWLYDVLSIPELQKIAEHEINVIEPSSEVIINIPISLLELELLKFGEILKTRNCFELYKRKVRSVA